MESEEKRPSEEQTTFTAEAEQTRPKNKLRTAFFALCIAFALLLVLGIVLGMSKVQMCKEVRFFTCDSRGFRPVSCGVQTVKRKYAKNKPSQMTIITGPSRNTDIEQTLVIGASGIRQVAVFLVDEE